MKLRSIPHLIGQGFVSFWRNGVMTTAAILVLICCMLVLGSFYIVIDSINRFIDEQIDNNKTITAYVNSDVSRERIDEILEELAALKEKENSNIVSYEHRTKDQVLQQMIEDNKNNANEEMAEILSKLDPQQTPGAKNPLPDEFVINFESFEGDAMRGLMRDMESIFGEKHIESNFDTYKSLQNLRATAAMVGLWLMGLLLIVAILVIMNTVKLTVYARRKEITTMRHIGATGAFVVSPFIVEGVVIGLVSTVISYGLQFALYRFVIGSIVENYMLIEMKVAQYFVFTVTDTGITWPVIPFAFLAVGLFAGVVSSAISVKKHLKA